MPASRKRSAVLGIAWLGAACLAGGPAAAAGPAPGEGFEVAAYAVDLTPDLKTRQLAGRETIELRALTDGLSAVAFSPNGLTVTAASLDGAPLTLAADKTALVLRLPRPLKAGRRVTLKIAYGGVPSRGLTATPAGLYTSYFACDWMVCLQDAPGDKARFALDLHLPAGVTSLSVGRRTAVRPDGAGRMVHRWRLKRPYPAYLFGFAAGRFAEASTATPGGTLRFLDATGAAHDLARMFAQTGPLVAFFSEKAGAPLPDGAYAQLLVPGSEAQEAASFALIGADDLERDLADPPSGWVVAHELAHQWWGNLVTCASWRDFWLNEGVTTFMVAAWKEHRFGPAAYEAELGVARARLERARQIGFDKPLAWGGAYPSLSARRAVQYSKGALFLAELRAQLGEEAFWAGLKGFTRAHAGGTVTSKDFQRAMEQASGRDLSAIFARWVYEG